MAPAQVQRTVTGNQLIDLGMAAVHGFGKVVSLFGGAAKWVSTAIAAVSLVVALYAGLLFYTARGLLEGAAWAWFSGVALLVVACLFWSAVALSTRGLRRLISLLVSSACGYGVWLLMRN